MKRIKQLCKVYDAINNVVNMDSKSLQKLDKEWKKLFKGKAFRKVEIKK